jgi:hypothetical protein
MNVNLSCTSWKKKIMLSTNCHVHPYSGLPIHYVVYDEFFFFFFFLGGGGVSFVIY